MANTGKRGNMDIENEERKAPGGERTGSGSQNVQGGRHTPTEPQRSSQQGSQQKGQKGHKDDDRSF
ncbi:MAG: hypothetical protein HY231_18700 [Acidobacteria bacterium]|nr:hypothetical protein [Acidobacteriota bacterium]